MGVMVRHQHTFSHTASTVFCKSLKGMGEFVWLLSSNVNNLSPELKIATIYFEYVYEDLSEDFLGHVS